MWNGTLAHTSSVSSLMTAHGIGGGSKRQYAAGGSLNSNRSSSSKKPQSKRHIAGMLLLSSQPKDCTFCTSSTRATVSPNSTPGPLNSLIPNMNGGRVVFPIMVHKALYIKYSSSQNYYYTKDLNDILGNARTTTVIKYKDFLMLDESDEYLKRFYRREEYPTKIGILTEYYKFHNDVPRLFMNPETTVYNRFIDKKRRLDYIRITKMLKMEDQPNTNEDQSGDENNESVKPSARGPPPPPTERILDNFDPSTLTSYTTEHVTHNVPEPVRQQPLNDKNKQGHVRRQSQLDKKEFYKPVLSRNPVGPPQTKGDYQTNQGTGKDVSISNTIQDLNFKLGEIINNSRLYGCGDNLDRTTTTIHNNNESIANLSNFLKFMNKVNGNPSDVLPPSSARDNHHHHQPPVPKLPLKSSAALTKGPASSGTAVLKETTTARLNTANRLINSGSGVNIAATNLKGYFNESPSLAHKGQSQNHPNVISSQGSLKGSLTHRPGTVEVKISSGVSSGLNSGKNSITDQKREKLGGIEVAKELLRMKNLDELLTRAALDCVKSSAGNYPSLKNSALSSYRGTSSNTATLDKETSNNQPNIKASGFMAKKSSAALVSSSGNNHPSSLATARNPSTTKIIDPQVSLNTNSNSQLTNSNKKKPSSHSRVQSNVYPPQPQKMTNNFMVESVNLKQSGYNQLNGLHEPSQGSPPSNFGLGASSSNKQFPGQETSNNYMNTRSSPQIAIQIGQHHSSKSISNMQFDSKETLLNPNLGLHPGLRRSFNANTNPSGINVATPSSGRPAASQNQQSHRVLPGTGGINQVSSQINGMMNWSSRHKSTKSECKLPYYMNTETTELEKKPSSVFKWHESGPSLTRSVQNNALKSGAQGLTGQPSGSSTGRVVSISLAGKNRPATGNPMVSSGKPVGSGDKRIFLRRNESLNGVTLTSRTVNHQNSSSQRGSPYKAPLTSRGGDDDYLVIKKELIGSLLAGR